MKSAPFCGCYFSINLFKRCVRLFDRQTALMSDPKSKPGRLEAILLIAGICSFLVGAGLKLVSFISEVVLRVTTQPVYDGKSHPEMKDSWGMGKVGVILILISIGLFFCGSMLRKMRQGSKSA